MSSTLRLITFLILWFVIHACFADSTAAENIQWQNYSDAIFAQAKEKKQLILVFGQSKTCHWCQQMEKTTWKTPSVIHEVQSNFMPVIVDVDAQINIAIRYRMTSLPTMLILNSDNQIIKIFSGYFTPDVMEKNLVEVTKNYIAPQGNNLQPQVVVEDTASAAPALLSADLNDQLKKKQLAIFEKIQTDTTPPANLEYLDSSSLQYALLLAQENEKLAHNVVTNLLKSWLRFADPVDGGFYTSSANGTIDYEKNTAIQAHVLLLFSAVYIYWHDPLYESTAKKLIDYVNNFLTSPDGVFYAGQAAYSTLPKQNEMYYQSDAAHRSQLGIPVIDKHIYAAPNGLMIRALADYYSYSKDNAALNAALKATHWITGNLSVAGGFRHEKGNNDTVYLNDTLAMGQAFLTLYKVTTNLEYLNRAEDAAKFINKYFPNADGKGYITSLNLAANSNAPVIIDAVENTDLIDFTSLLYSYTGDNIFQQMRTTAAQYLMMPEVINKNLPATILLAENRIAIDPPHIIVVGAKNDPTAIALFQTTLQSSPHFARIDWWDRNEGPLQNSDVVYPVLDKAVAYVCYRHHCSFPIYHSEDLLEHVHNLILPEKEAIPLAAATNELPVVSSPTLDHPNAAEQLLIKMNWFFIVVGFTIFGLLLSFTPCILPLMPIMASVIVGQTIGVKKEKTFMLCLAYVFAMSVTYAVLGVVAGIFGLYLQAFIQNTWVLVLFSLIFLLLALSMLEVYELTIPRGILQKINGWSNLQTGGNFFGVMVMGSLSTLIVSPCVSAPLAGVLSFITKTSDYMLGAVGLFCMGFGMGLPLLIVSIFSKNILPRVTHWNTQIKIFFGLISLGVSIWILARVISLEASMILWAAYIFFVTIYMGVFKRKTRRLHEKIWKTLTLMMFMYGVALLLNVLFLNSDTYKAIISNQKIVAENQNRHFFKEIKNKVELAQALSQARAIHMPVILDFTAGWCTSCVNLDHHVFNNPQVLSLFRYFILLRVNLTKMDSNNMEIVKQYHVAGPPMILFFDAKGQPINFRTAGDVDLDEFIRILQQVLQLH